MRTKTLSRLLSRCALGACSAAIVEAALAGCGGLVAIDAVERPDATTSDSSEGPDAANDGVIATRDASVATANDGGSSGDAADAWPGDCPPPSDPYWNGFFSDASVDAAAACGLTRSGACNATVTGELVCAAIAHGAVTTFNSCPFSLCGSCGGYCSIAWGPEWQSTDGAVLRTTDDAGNCLIPMDAVANVICSFPGGRPPAGLGAIVASGTTRAAALFARQAVLEAASVDAFVELAANLRWLGAPDALVRDCEEAAREEESHARLIGALAHRYGGAFEAPSIARQEAYGSVFEIALANATEGLVGETFAAAVATHEALRAKDLDAAATLAQVAQEEISHAELSRRIHAWAMPQLDDESRARIASAMTHAISELGEELARSRHARCDTASDRADSTSLGIPTSAEARALHAALARGLWDEELSRIAS